MSASDAFAQLGVDVAEMIEPYVPTQPFNGWVPDWRLIGLPGVEQVRWGGPPRLDPVGTLLDLQASEIRQGTVTLTMPWSEWLLGSDGLTQPGILAALADATHSAAVYSTFPPMCALATTDLSLSFHGEPADDAGSFTCTASVVDSGQSHWPVLSVASITDAHGRLLAHTTARCVPQPIPGDPPSEGPDAVPPVDLESRMRSPSREHARGDVVPMEEWQRCSGLDILGRLAQGELALPPIFHLTGLRPAKIEPERAIFAMPASRWVASLTGNVHGGLLALLAEASMSGVVGTTLDAGRCQHAAELRFRYLQPVLADGQTVLGCASIDHRGRSIAFTNCELLDITGKRVALATATHAL
jgi:uncharacterized protein (TIGR00369 family)